MKPKIAGTMVPHSLVLFPLLFLFLLFPLAAAISDPSHAITIQNCSGSPINVETSAETNRNASTTRNDMIAMGHAGSIRTRAPLVGIRIFEAGVFRTIRISINRLDATGEYSTIRIPNGQWQLVSGRAC